LANKPQARPGRRAVGLLRRLRQMARKRHRLAVAALVDHPAEHAERVRDVESPNRIDLERRPSPARLDRIALDTEELVDAFGARLQPIPDSADAAAAGPLREHRAERRLLGAREDPVRRGPVRGRRAALDRRGAPGDLALADRDQPAALEEFFEEFGVEVPSAGEVPDELEPPDFAAMGAALERNGVRVLAG